MLKNKLWIELQKKGINYKKLEMYDEEKIVVRKTGIGISACIDYEFNLTNQVVYIFKLKEKFFGKILLELFLMIINSRMAFFFVAMSNGEIEWKSHPYVTQKQILNIPIPYLNDLSDETKNNIKKYSIELKKQLKKKDGITPKLDSNIERLVAEIYSLDYSDYKIIFTAIQKAQDLKSVKALKLVDADDVFKKGLN